MSPAPTAYVIGEALTDIVDGPEGIHEHPGGSPMNVAIGLARLDIPVVLHTRFGLDERGAAINRHLEASSVAVTAGSRDAGDTATARATLDRDGAASYRFEITGALAEPEIPADVRLVHTGSIAAYLEPGADLIEAALGAVRPRALVSFDPNMRPLIIPEHQSVVQRTERLAALADIVKLSDEDAEWLYPGLALPAVLDRLASRGGAGLVAVTRGAEGCLILAGGELYTLPAPRVSVVDTIGAGDSFMAAMLAAVLEVGADEAVRAGTLDSRTLTRIGETALRAAAITVSRAGANPPRRAEL